MGLMKEEDKVVILTDIQGMEDFLGDMDFKVAGSDSGITAIQMDIKIAGIDRDILKAALEQARKGRLFILDKMNSVIDEPREELSPYAPKIITTRIDPDKIRDVIGPGGKTINKIIAETGLCAASNTVIECAVSHRQPSGNSLLNVVLLSFSPFQMSLKKAT